MYVDVVSMYVRWSGEGELVRDATGRGEGRSDIDQAR